MPSRAEQLFEEIMASPAERLGRLIDDKTPESEILDYKSGKIQHKELRAIWAKCLCGFGNTDGGVVVFGIDARRIEVPDENGVIRMLDVPSNDPAYCLDSPALAEKLKANVRDLTENPVLGVRIEPVGELGRGYVVCFIPSGNDKPYRSTVDHVHYMRLQDGFSPIPQSMLRAMFYPRTKPSLSFRVVTSVTPHWIDYTFHLVNRGTATAKEIVVDVRADRKLETLTAAAGRFRDFAIEMTKSECNLGGGLPLHPGAEVALIQVRWKHVRNLVPEAVPPAMTVNVYMADQELVRFSFKLRGGVEVPPNTYEIAPVE